MGVSKKFTIFCVFVLSVFLVGAYAGEKKEIKKSFGVHKTVKLALVSGDCSIETGDKKEITLSVIHTYKPEKYEVVVEKRDGTLVLKEKFKGSGSGDSVWTLNVPRDTEIVFTSASGDADIKGLTSGLTFKSASGDLECGDIKGDISVSTASGDLEINNISGNITVKTASGDIEGGNLKGKMAVKSASGDIELKGLTGSLNVKTASGEIELEGFIVKGDSIVKTASGEIEVKLGESAKYNLTLISASGDVVLDYDGKSLKGQFEFSARKTSGNIIAPEKFQKTEETKHHGQKYLMKSFSIGGNSPKIILKTSSGTVELKK